MCAGKQEINNFIWPKCQIFGPQVHPMGSIVIALVSLSLRHWIESLCSGTLEYRWRHFPPTGAHFRTWFSKCLCTGTVEWWILSIECMPCALSNIVPLNILNSAFHFQFDSAFHLRGKYQSTGFRDDSIILSTRLPVPVYGLKSSVPSRLEF